FAVRIFEDMVNYVNQADTMTGGIWQPPADTPGSAAAGGAAAAATAALQQVSQGLAKIPGASPLASQILSLVAGALGVPAPPSTPALPGSGTTITTGTLPPLTPALGH